MNCPPIFTRINVDINARNAFFPAFRVAQLEVFAAMLTGNQVCILAGVECAVWRSEKFFEKIADPQSRREPSLVVPESISLCVNAQVVRLPLHDFLKMRMLPITVGRVLVNTTPSRIHKLELRGERFASHAFRTLVSALRFAHRVLDDVRIEEFLNCAPATILWVVTFNQNSTQFVSRTVCKLRFRSGLERGLFNDRRTRRGIIDNCL